MSAENDRPLAGLSTAEAILALERFKGEVNVEFTRQDEVIKGLTRDVERTEKFKELALTLAAQANKEHLELLNNNTAKILAAHNEADVKRVAAEARLQTIDAAGRDKKELDEKIAKLEGEGSFLKGRLSLPLALISMLIGAGAAKLLFP